MFKKILYVQTKMSSDISNWTNILSPYKLVSREDQRTVKYKLNALSDWVIKYEKALQSLCTKCESNVNVNMDDVFKNTSVGM